jgi:hypothetical protein
MVAIMAESGRDFYHVFSHAHKPVTDSMNDNEVIQRVPVIHMVASKCEKKEAHRELTPIHATTGHCNAVVTDNSITGVQSEVSVTVSVDNNVTNDMLGVLFPHNPSDIEAFGQQFNLEFLENNFVSNLIGAVDTENIEHIAHELHSRTSERDILSDAVGEIVNDAPSPENKISEHNYTQTKSLRKGRKRGRKLGYRSENSNADNALCGVCGEKERTILFACCFSGI